MDDILLAILKDSFFSNFALTVNSEFAYPLVLMFGKYNATTATAAALVGSVTGLMASFFLFVAVGIAMKKLLESNPGFTAAKHYINKLSPVFGALTAVPELSVIPTFFCGITRMDAVKFLMIVTLYRIAFYAYMLSSTHTLYQ